MFRFRQCAETVRSAFIGAAATIIFALMAVGPASAGFSEAFDQYLSKDYEAARLAARDDAERGNPAAQWLLGTMYLLGQGVAEDPAQARVWLEKSASANYPPAQAVLGRMFEEGIGGGQDSAEAHILYRLSAEQGYADAAYLLGRQFYFAKARPGTALRR